jgi:hypothetical protein
MKKIVVYCIRATIPSNHSQHIANKNKYTTQSARIKQGQKTASRFITLKRLAVNSE